MPSPGISPSFDCTLAIRALIRQQLYEHAPQSVLYQAFDVLHPMYSELLNRFARRYLDAAEAEDLTQEVWVQALVNLARFDWRTETSMRSWLCTLLRNRALNKLRAKRRRPAKLGQHRELAAAVDPALGPANELEAHWHREQNLSLFPILKEKLKPAEYRLLELRFREGKSPAEIGRELGITAEQVSYRQYRLLKKLRKTLGVYFGEESVMEH